MKKALSLLLAALLVLTSVVALAAETSPVTAKVTNAEGADVVAVDNPTINEQVAKTIEALAGMENVLDAFDAEVQDALKEIFGDAALTVNEIAAIAVNNIAEDAETVKFDLAVVTPYAVGQKVSAVIEIHPDLTNYEQVVAKAEVVEEGKVSIEMTKEDAQKIADALYSVVIIVSEK